MMTERHDLGVGRQVRNGAGQIAQWDELRALDKSGQASLEDIFLSLTGGSEEAEIAEILK